MKSLLTIIVALTLANNARAATPVLSGISPSVGTIAGGTGVVITGTNLDGATRVAFGGVTAGYTANSSTQITATSPVYNLPGIVDVAVTTPGGTAHTSFTYILPPPTVTSIGPSSGTTAGGTIVLIQGTYLDGATTITFDGINASYTLCQLVGGPPGSSTCINATAPAHTAGTVSVVVNTSRGSASGTFTYLPPPPTITSLNQTSGITAAGASFVITGVNLSGATTVTFNGVGASYAVISSTQITATAPRLSLAVTIQLEIRTPSGPGSFTYVFSAPTITSISPTYGATSGGTSIIITGTNLHGVTNVIVRGVSSAFTVNSPTQITATTPPSPSGTATVTLEGLAGSVIASFTYVPLAPTITSISPSSGTTAGGTNVVINGTNLTDTTNVTFDGVSVSHGSINYVDGSQGVTATAPAHALGSVTVIVTTPGGSASTSFTYLPSAPTITSISPISGPSTGGTLVTITGTNLAGATGVSFSGASASYTVDSSTRITATAPAHVPGYVSVGVTTPGGPAVASTVFTYLPPAPSIISISPSSGPTAGHTSVVISGTNLTGATSVTFGSVQDTFIVVSDTTINATTPPLPAGTVSVFVTTPSGSSNKNILYTTIAPPEISSINPSSGTASGGTRVTITGRYLTGASNVTFSGKAATNLTILDDSTIAVTTPSGSAGAVNLQVTTPYGSVANGLYRYVSPPTITGANPVMGTTLGGTRVRLTGTNFTGVTSVTFGGQPASGFSVDSDSIITATTPPGAEGAASIQVVNSVGSGGSTSVFSYVGDWSPREYAYIADAENQTVVVLQTSSGAIIARIPVGRGPSAIAINPQATRVFVANALDSSLSVIDTTTNGVIGTIIVGSSPQGIAITPDGLTAYVANATSNNVSVVNLTANRVTDTIPVGSNPNGVAVNPAGTRAYITNLGGNSVSVINTATNTVIATVNVGTSPRKVAASNSSAFITNYGSSSVTVLRLSNNTVLGTVSVGANPWGVALDPTGITATISNLGANTVSLMNASTTGVVGTVSIKTTPNSSISFLPTDISIDSTGRYAYVISSVSSGDSSVAIIDIVRKTFAGTLPIGGRLSALAIADIQGAAPLPRIDSITPGVGQTTGGTSVLITGANLTGVNAVTFDGIAGTNLQVLSDASLRVTTPPGKAGTVSVTARNATASSPAVALFTYIGSSSLSSSLSIQAISPEPSTAGQAYSVSVRVTASIGTPSGTVRITDGSTNCDTILAAGIGSCSLVSDTSGSKTIQASYAGDVLYQPSSGTATHAVSLPLLQILNGASFSSAVAPNSWISIFGSNFGPPGLRIWQWSDFDGDKLPLGLDGVSVSVDGRAIPMDILTTTQINALLPANIAVGQHTLAVTTPTRTVSQEFKVVAAAPAFFISHYASGIVPFGAIINGQGTPTGWPDNLPGGVPALPGSEVSLWATGFGIDLTESIDSYRIPSSQVTLRSQPTCQIYWGASRSGAQALELTYAALSGIGLYQINANLPAALVSGTYEISCKIREAITSPAHIAVSTRKDLHVSTNTRQISPQAAGGISTLQVTVENLPGSGIQPTATGNMFSEIQLVPDGQNPSSFTVSVRTTANTSNEQRSGYILIGPLVITATQGTMSQ